ncbi:peptidylprolyl isomerase [Pseudoalteromonas gelatinilytica]|uniref:peptidylprolyl isomerase n=1 Tax=Pseudoalteromonas gelatinilytica TaxID=1703256 RepID=A0A3A3EN15_9GAMM|nr:peptidylprolyl isomerase [Pseudoalteromonas profundi]RJF34298.1 peptidylprolyl isomerase [Pseudoalteromonas profundi]
MKLSLLTLCLGVVLAAPISAKETSQKRSAGEIIKTASSSEWRKVSAENVIKLTLPTGAAYIELNDKLAPIHANNMRQLAKEGFYQGLSVYRFVEGFVAQGGDVSENKPVKNAKKGLPAEFYLRTETPVAITELKGPDGYAAKTGFLNGFAVAQSQSQTETWQVHCPGIFAMARDNDINSGGTEFYVTIGNSQRYLDRNITVFGRVLEGMEHFNLLQRKATEGQPFNPITDMQVLADIKDTDNSEFRVMKTDSNAFKDLIEARKNRVEAWFVESPDHIDVCAMPIPTERIK